MYPIGLSGGRRLEVTSRAKTISTLREKLERMRWYDIGRIEDLAGVRVETEMSLREQDDLVKAIVTTFGPEHCVVHDLRETPRFGYRAVHIRLRLPAGRVEIQVRTHLQGLWANGYEALADLYGRGIRYGEPPGGEAAMIAVQELQRFSTVRLTEFERVWEALLSIEQAGEVLQSVQGEGFADLVYNKFGIPVAGMDKRSLGYGTPGPLTGVEVHERWALETRKEEEALTAILVSIEQQARRALKEVGSE